MEETPIHEEKHVMTDAEALAVIKARLIRLKNTLNQSLASWHINTRWKIYLAFLLVLNVLMFGILEILIQRSLYPSPTDLVLIVLFVPLPILLIFRSYILFQ